MRVLVACEFSGVIRNAFIRKGHDAWSCDLLPSGGNHICKDVLEVIDDGWDLVIAHPPCTHTALSGRRWFKEKIADGRQQEGIDFFMRFTELNVDKVCIEHPMSIMSKVYRPPDQIIQPWMFGHGEVKSICLWLKNLPYLVPTDVVSGREQKVHNMTSKDRSMKRSITYRGIASAMADQYSVY